MTPAYRRIAVSVGIVQVLLVVLIAGCSGRVSEASLLREAEKWCDNNNKDKIVAGGETRYMLAWSANPDAVDIIKTDSVVYPYTGTVEVVNLEYFWDAASQKGSHTYFDSTVISFRFHNGRWEQQ